MKNNPFADLTSGDMSKYKERNDAAIRLERAEALDARITALNADKKDLAWADSVFKFYDKEKRINSDIFDISAKAPVLEQMKKEAKFIKEKDAEEKAQLKKDAEKKIAEEALAIDEYITELSGAPRSIYWCDDVTKTDERVKNLSSDTRSKCKKLSLLDSLKIEVGYVNEAAELDKKIKAFKSNKTHGETWSRNVVSFAAGIDKNVLPYMKEKPTCDELVRIANDALDAINAERARLVREEAYRKAREKAARDAEEAKQRAAEEARKKALEEEKKKKVAEEARRAHEEYLANKKREELKKRSKIRIRNIICASFTVLSLALIAVSIFVKSARMWAIGGIAAIVYVAVWFLIQFPGFFNHVPDIDFTGCKNRLETSFSIVNSIVMSALIPLLCISDGTRQFAFVFSIGILAQSILRTVFSVVFSYQYPVTYGLHIEISGYLLVIAFSLCFLSGWARYLTIGIGLMLVSLVYFIISKASYLNDYSDESYLVYGIVKMAVLSVAGIAFLFVSPEFAVLSVFAFATAAMTVAFTFFDKLYLYHLHALWYLIPVGVSFLVLFLMWL